ncbi:sulfatase, partial [Parapusillimonas sp. SGNA-6]|nr:sulfatase [Parapusillimonas sp. SGNA-6]
MNTVWLSNVLVSVCCWLGVSLFAFGQTNPSKNYAGDHRKPNIVIIMADDLDSKQLSCYGGQNLKTHHIDELAASGMRFTNMIASEAMCVPTRASLFTGLYPARHGAYQNHKAVNDGLKSVCHYLADLGYRVGLTGKNHVTKPREIFPFDIVPGFEPNCVKRTDDYFLDSIERYITAPEPYCLFVMSINPHVPWTAGDPSEFDPQKLILPAHWVDTPVTRRNFANFLAEIRRLDNQVGDVMKMLEKNGQLDNTIVMFLGEQGPQFPRGKWTLWDYGQRSSMIVRWPGVVGKGSTSEALAQYEDVVPTLIEIAGGQKRDDLDGISFLSV